MRRTNQKHEKHRPQRSPDRTTKWKIGLFKGKVYVSDKESKLLKHGCFLTQEIRSITPQAAARRFIRNTLPGMMLCSDTEGRYEPSEIKTHNSKKKENVYIREARRYQDLAKKRAKNTEFVIVK